MLCAQIPMRPVHTGYQWEAHSHQFGTTIREALLDNPMSRGKRPAGQNW